MHRVGCAALLLTAACSNAYVSASEDYYSYSERQECSLAEAEGAKDAGAEGVTGLLVGSCAMSSCIMPGLGFTLVPIAKSVYPPDPKSASPTYEHCYKEGYVKEARRRRTGAVVVGTLAGSAAATALLIALILSL